MTPRTRRSTRVLAACAAAVPLALILGGCGPLDVTPQRLEASITTVFPNYYVQLQDLLGHPGVTAAALGARASCDKGGPNIADKGAGNDWLCLVDWTDRNGVHCTDADPASPASKFELKVSSNGCYIAGGSTKTFGPVQLQGPDGTYVNNPVFEFDGCFNGYDNNTGLSRAVLPALAPTPTGSPCLTASLAPTPTETAMPTETATPSATSTPTASSTPADTSATPTATP